ncbi:MAG: glycosyltransferase family 39 protein [Methanobrevibacter thaueri]|nr:glycosyltransferase family 39 protein [Methanobrevibacter thaueri]
MNLSDFNINKSDKIFLIILFIFAFLCTLKMTLFCLSGGILNPDVSLYLISGLKYAGMDYYNIVNPHDLYFTPVISFLSSLFFRLGFVNQSVIMIITGIFGFFGYIGLYLLLRNRFNPLLSLSGVIIYGSLSVVLFNLGKGLIDLPAVSFSIWVLVFAIMAIDKNPKYYLIVFPLFVIGFFVKYIVGFTLPLIVLYYLFNKDLFNLLNTDKKQLKNILSNYLKSKEFKYICISLVIALILAVIICKTLILDFGGSLTFFNQSVRTFTESGFNENSINYLLDKLFYVHKLPYVLFILRRSGNVLTTLIIGIFSIGFILALFNLLRNIKVFKYLKNNKLSFNNRYFSKLLVLLLVLSVIGVFVGFKYLSNSMFSNICVLIAITCIFVIFEKYNITNKNFQFDLLFLAYFSITFIFISLYPIKVARYFLMVLPAFIYFIVWGLDSITNFCNTRFDDCESFKFKLTNNFDVNYSKSASIVPVLVILLFLISTVLFIGPMQLDDHNKVYDDVLKQGFVNDLVDACDYIKNTDANYHSKSFASYNHHERTIRWYLNVNVTILDEESPDLEEFNNTTYIILKYDKDFDNYHKIKNCGDFNIYQHN